MQEIVVIDSQRLNTIQLCARKYDYTFEQQLVPYEKQPQFERGDLMHKMLEYYYKLKVHRRRWAQNNHTHAKIVDICVRIGEHFAIKMDLPTEECMDIIYQFREYCKFYEFDGWEPIAIEGVASKVLYEDEELKIIYEGKIDLIISLKNVPVMPWDHKTSKRRGETISLSNQFIGYAWLLGVKNVGINKIGFQKTLKPEERFQRPVMSYCQDVIDEWRENTIWWTKMLMYHLKTRHFPYNFTSCDKWSGCIFREICESERGVRQWKARTLFEVAEKWDVGKGL